MEFVVHLKTWFLDLHQVKVTCYCCYLLLYSNKKTLLNIISNLLQKKSWNDTKCIFHERDNKLLKHFEVKSFSVLSGVNGLPPNTLKLFFGEIFYYFFSLIMKNLFLSFQDFLHNNLLMLFNNVLCYCKGFNNYSNKRLLIDVNPENSKGPKT